MGSLLSYLTLRDENSFFINLSKLWSIVWEWEFELLRNFFVVLFLNVEFEDFLSSLIKRYRLRDIEKEFFLLYDISLPFYRSKICSIM